MLPNAKDRIATTEEVPFPLSSHPEEIGENGASGNIL
jgi:hypothetical protein